MAITPTDFEKIWSTNASTPAYTFSDADYLEGWDFVGNLPPTRAQWNAIQKRTDEKMKYVFDNFGAPLMASTVAEMTLQNRVYVYTGSEVGYTAGDWYYYDAGTSTWVDGGVYNAVAIVTDTTLTQAGVPADAKATGDTFNLIQGSADAITWEYGTISNGSEAVNNKRIRTVYAFHVNVGDSLVVTQSNKVRYAIVTYNAGGSVSMSAYQTALSYTFNADAWVRVVASNYSQTDISAITDVSSYIVITRYNKLNKVSNAVFTNIIPSSDWEVGGLDSHGFTQVVYRIRTRSLYHVHAGDSLLFENGVNTNFAYAIAFYSGGELTSVKNYIKTNAYVFSADADIRIVLGDQSSYTAIGTTYGSMVNLMVSDVRNSMVYSTRQIDKNAIYSYEKIGLPADWVRNYNFGLSLANDFCFVGDELWLFSSGDDNDPTSLVGYYRFSYDADTDTFTSLGGVQKHNLGHVNSIEYNKFNDCLICGNGSGNYALANKIYIVPHASQIPSGTNIDTTQNCIVIDCSAYSLGTKLNVVWGDANVGGNNICYFITNDNGIVRRVQLGKGTTEFEYGTIIPNTPADEFNGTFKILSEHRQSDYGYETCVQGSVYSKGILYAGIGHSTGSDRIWAMSLCLDGTIRRVQYDDVLTSGSGTPYGSIGGLTIHDGYLYIAQSNLLQKYKM